MTMPAYDIHGILTIRADRPIHNDAFHRYFAVDEVDDPDLLILNTDKRTGTRNLHRHDNWFYGGPDSDFVYYRDRLLGQDDCVWLAGLLADRTVIEYNTIDRPNVTPRSRGSVDDLIESVIDFKLIERGYTTIHAASLSKDGHAILLAGFPNVGKTLSTLALLQDGWAYMGDDNGLIGRDGQSYAYPSTSSIGYHDFLKYIEPDAIGRRQYYKHLARVWPMQFAPVERLFDYPEVYLPDIGFEQGDVADIDTVVGLAIGPRSVNEVSTRQMASKVITSTDYSRPRIWQNPFFQVWAYFNPDIIEDYRSNERAIVQAALTDADCYTATCQQRDWGDILEQVIRPVVDG